MASKEGGTEVSKKPQTQKNQTIVGSVLFIAVVCDVANRKGSSVTYFSLVPLLSNRLLRYDLQDS